MSSPEYDAWEQQDQILVGSKHAWMLWDKVHAYFQQQGHAKLWQLRSDLRNTHLDSCKNYISEFLLKIHSLIGSINAIGETISVHEHLDVILEGLPQEFESTISLISGKFDSISIEVETLLLCHEARLDPFIHKP